MVSKWRSPLLERRSWGLTGVCVQLVELKNGDTYNGHLVNCDTWMNVNLREVICTSKDGDRFWKMPECYIRGNTIKYIRVPNEVGLRSRARARR